MHGLDGRQWRVRLSTSVTRAVTSSRYRFQHNESPFRHTESSEPLEDFFAVYAATTPTAANSNMRECVYAGKQTRSNAL